jgi:hypothetical protein
VLVDLGDYYYHMTAAPASGEYALAYIFRPGAWAHHPIGPRLVDSAKRATLAQREPGSLNPGESVGYGGPVTFLYGGSHDWMSAPAGAAVAASLRSLGIKSRCFAVPESGHHLYLENPDIFNAIVLHEIAVPTDKPVAGGATLSPNFRVSDYTFRSRESAEPVDHDVDAQAPLKPPIHRSPSLDAIRIQYDD